MVQFLKHEPKRLLVKFFKSFTTEIKEVEVSFDSHISRIWHVVVSPYFRPLCLVLDGLDFLRVALDVFEVVVKIFEVVVGGFRWF